MITAGPTGLDPVESDRLRLAFIADPNSIHTRRWISFFANRGHEVHLFDGFGVAVTPGLDDRIAMEHYAANPRPQIPVVSLLRGRRNLRRLLGELQPNVLHAFDVHRYGWQAALAGFHPLIVSPWGSDLLRVAPHANRDRWWNRFTLRAADLITVSSDWMRATAVQAGALPDRISLIPHGVDTRLFSPGPSDPALRDRLALQDASIILAPRAIRPLYRQEIVVEALAALSTPSRRPIAIMSARQADAGYLAALLSRARDLGVADQLRVLDDVAHEELPNLLRLADAVVSVPDSDSFPVTILEAMACGRPVVASDLPAVAPVLAAVDPVARDFLVPVGDVTATAAAIRRALDLGVDERKRLGDAFRAFVIRTADYETSMRLMERLYRQLRMSR